MRTSFSDLKIVYDEALRRNYHFNLEKIGCIDIKVNLAVTKSQIRYETRHLLSKLEIRDPEKFIELSKIIKPEPHPLFIISEGEIENWEKN